MLRCPPVSQEKKRTALPRCGEKLKQHLSSSTQKFWDGPVFEHSPKSSVSSLLRSIAHPMGLKPKTKAGAVSHEIRIFFEALTALEPLRRTYQNLQNL